MNGARTRISGVCKQFGMCLDVCCVVSEGSCIGTRLFYAQLQRCFDMFYHCHAISTSVSYFSLNIVKLPWYGLL